MFLRHFIDDCLDLNQQNEFFLFKNNPHREIIVGKPDQEMTTNRIVKVMSAAPIFKGLNVEQLESIRYISITKDCAKGQTIFSEGDDGNGFYIIVSGRVKIYKASSDGKEQILHIFGPGEPFGEVPVFTGASFPATAVCIAKTQLLFFPKPAFIDLITKNPMLSIKMLGLLSLRLREFTVHIENLSLKEVPGRLSSYLLYLSEEQGRTDCVNLNVSKSQLASLLGTIPETLSRIFARMTTGNLIRVQGNEIYLTDRDGLEKLADIGKLAA